MHFPAVNNVCCTPRSLTGQGQRAQPPACREKELIADDGPNDIDRLRVGRSQPDRALARLRPGLLPYPLDLTSPGLDPKNTVHGRAVDRATGSGAQRKKPV